MKFPVFLLFLILLSGASFAQDPQFTQFYAAPLYLNPGFAGSSENLRTNFIARAQWAGLPKPFYTYAASADHYMPKIKSGIGMLLVQDKAGSGVLSNTSASLFYTYKIQLTEKLVMRPGVQFGMVSRGINNGAVVLYDQLDPNYVQSGIPGEVVDNSRVNYFDFSSGTLIHDHNFWAGLAFHHLNKPDESLHNGNSRIPVKMSLHGGYRFHMVGKAYRKAYGEQRDINITPAFYYKKQDKYDQLDIGLYYQFEPLLIGVWYRGLPLKKYKAGYNSNDAVAVLLGYKIDKFSVGYSYDLTVSRLSPTGTSGSHELSLSYVFDTRSKYKRKDKVRRKDMVIPCPDF